MSWSKCLVKDRSIGTSAHLHICQHGCTMDKLWYIIDFLWKMVIYHWFSIENYDISWLLYDGYMMDIWWIYDYYGLWIIMYYGLYHDISWLLWSWSILWIYYGYTMESLDISWTCVNMRMVYDSWIYMDIWLVDIYVGYIYADCNMIQNLQIRNLNQRSCGNYRQKWVYGQVVTSP